MEYMYWYIPEDQIWGNLAALANFTEAPLWLAKKLWFSLHEY